MRLSILSAILFASGVSVAACQSGGEDATAAESNATGKPGSAAPPGSFDTSKTDAGGQPSPCGDDPGTPAGADAVLAPAYTDTYRTFELGAVPGVPGPLGGCVIKRDDPNTLYVAGGSEGIAGAIYTIGLKRGKCGHVTGFEGTAKKIAQAPSVDANLVFTGTGLMLYTKWPDYGFGQLLPGATSPSKETDLKALGMGGGGAGGLGFVPPGLANEGELRAVTWPDGIFYHLATKPNGALVDVTAVNEKVRLDGGPGGFAYVPAGSPGFAKQSLVVGEWELDRIATYEVNASGDPIKSSRKEFFTKFPRPWGAYFEPLTGDFIFLTWGRGTSTGDGGQDKMFVVRGFAVPPPPPVNPR